MNIIIHIYHDHHQGGVAIGEQGGDEGRPAARHQRGVRRGCRGARSSKSLSSSAIPLWTVFLAFLVQTDYKDGEI